MFATTVINIGKEADSFEEAEAFGAGEEDVTIYGASPPDRDAMILEIKAAPVRLLKEQANVGHALIGRACSGDPTVATRMMMRIYRAALTLRTERETAEAEERELCAWALRWSEMNGISSLAKSLKRDPANVRKAIKRGILGNLTNALRVLRQKEADPPDRPVKRSNTCRTAHQLGSQFARNRSRASGSSPYLIPL